MTADLVRLETDHSLNSPARCRATFVNIDAGHDGLPGYRYFDLDEVDFGTELAVFSGVPPNTLYPLFSGRVNLIAAQYPAQAAPLIVVEAEDGFQLMRGQQRTRTFEDLSDGQVIQQIASEYGLAAQLSLEGPVHARICQLNQSDYAFIADRVRAAGAMMWMEPGTLVVKIANDTPAMPETLEYGAALKQFEVQGDLRDQCTSVGVAGWDMRTATAIRQSVGDSVLEPGEPGRSGGRTLEEAFGQRLHTGVLELPDSMEEARQLARACYRERAGQFVTGSGVAAHLPGLRVGQQLTIRGVGSLFNGRYLVTRVQHSFDPDNGTGTRFEVRRDRIGSRLKIKRENTDDHSKRA
jgi:phage protein D